MLNYQITFKSQKSYYKLFKEAGISCQKSQKKNPKKDPEQVQEKKEEIKQKLSDWKEKINNGNLRVFLVDECHLLWGDICGYVWGKTSERVEVPMTNEREKQTSDRGFKLPNQRVFTSSLMTKLIPKRQLMDVKYLLAQCPSQKIAIIWDGASYHRYKKMKEYLEEVNGGLPPESNASYLYSVSS